MKIDWLDEATQSWRVVSAKPGVRAKEALAATGVETLHHYRSKTRRYINEKRQSGEPVMMKLDDTHAATTTTTTEASQSLRPILSPIGPAEIVWNKTRDACPYTKWVSKFHRNVPCEEPDSMPLAWHNPITNKSSIICSTDCTYAGIGDNLGMVSGAHDCSHSPYKAINDSRPWAYSNHQWMQATRVFPNGSGFALIHNEFHGEQEGNSSYCSFDSKTSTGQCIEWSTDLGKTTDGGATWFQTHAPLITLPRKYIKDGMIAGYGEIGSIMRNAADGFYYAHIARSYKNNTGGGPPGTVGNGSCVFRTADPSNPSSYRGWDGTGWTMKAVNPYEYPYPPTLKELEQRTCAAVKQGGDRSMHINPKQFAGPVRDNNPGWPTHVLLAWPSGRKSRVAYSFLAPDAAAAGPAPFTAWEAPTYLDVGAWMDPCTVGGGQYDWMCKCRYFLDVCLVLSVLVTRC